METLRYKINDELSLDAEEGFKLMTDDELSLVSSSDKSKRWGIWDKERHVMLLVDWKGYSGLLLGLTNIRKIAKRNEEQNRALYKGNDYRLDGELRRMVGGQEAEGYRFSYAVGEIKQSASCLLIRHKKNVYRFTCNGRSENRKADEALFGAALDTVKLG